MKYFIIAGERSGDLHGSYLISEILKKDPGADISFWGGDYMKRAGGNLLMHYRDTAVMGFLEVLKNLRKLARLQQKCKAQIREIKPDAIIFIDYPGFNLRIADFTRKHGFINFYYISPKVWAWNQKRALRIKRVVDRLFCILPFEPAFFARYGMDVTYVGNPLRQAISNYSFDQEFLLRFREKKVIGVLPGSRAQEVTNVLQIISEIAVRRPDYQFVLAGVDNLPVELYAKEKLAANMELVFDKTYEILKASEAVVVTSGTATLEAALLNAPQVVVYKTSNFSYQIAKRLIKVPYISLVNLIAGKEVVKELIQSEMTADNILRELDEMVSNRAVRQQIMDGYREINNLLGTQNAAATAAAEIVQFTRNGQKQKKATL